MIKDNDIRTQKKTGMLKKVAMLFLALYPLLGWYTSPVAFPLGTVIMLLLSLIGLFHNKHGLRIFPLMLYVVWIYISCNYYKYAVFSDWKSYLPGGLEYCVYIFSLFGAIVFFDIRYLKKYMKVIMLVGIFLFWIQYFALHLFNIHFCFVPNLTGGFMYEKLSYAQMYDLHMESTNPCSIFIEKSYMACYLLTYMIIEFFDNQGKQVPYTRLGVFILITLVFLKAGTGYVGLIVICVAKALTYFKIVLDSKALMIVLICVPLLYFGMIFFIQTDLGQEVVGRKSELEDSSTSGFSRVVAGYLMYDNMPDKNKLYGMPRTDFLTIDTTFYHTDDRFYVNGIQYILITLGLVGLIFYIVLYAYMYKKCDLISRLSILLLLSFSLIEATYCSVYMTVLTIIPCACLIYKKEDIILS